MNGLLEAIDHVDEAALEPLVDWPDGYGLYEVVLTGEGDPTPVRAYRGRDAVPRAVFLVKHGVTLDDDADGGIQAYVHEDPDVEHSRFVASTSEQAAAALEGALEAGTFTEVEL